MALDYSKLKDHLSNGPDITDEFFLRDHVMIEAMKSLITTNKDDSFSDAQIKKNIDTACKYAGAYMNARYFFNTCYTPGFAFNRPDGWEEVVSEHPFYPYDAPVGDYGLNTPLFTWEYDYILDCFSASIQIDTSFFPMIFGCGWEYCKTQLRVRKIGFPFEPPKILAYYQFNDDPDAPAWDNSGYDWIEGTSVAEMTRGDTTFISYPTEANMNNATNGFVRSVNNNGLATADGLVYKIFPYYYSMNSYNTLSDFLDNTGVIPTTLGSYGGLEAGEEYTLYLTYACDKTESGVCINSPTTVSYNFTVPNTPPYPPIA